MSMAITITQQPSSPEQPNRISSGTPPAEATAGPAAGAPPESPQAESPSRRRPKWLMPALVVLVLVVCGYFLVPRAITALTTVSTDDAYVNGHVTFVAPRVSGQVTRVLVDDNNRVRKGELLVQLDPEPYQVQVNIANAAVREAEADLVAALSTARGIAGRTRSLRYAMQHAMEDVDNQIALIRAKVAALDSEKAVLADAQHQYNRVKRLYDKKVAADQEMHDRIADLDVAKAKVEEALQSIYQVRVGLGLPPKPESGDLTEVPSDLNETHSSVREAQASLAQSATQLGISGPLEVSPRQMIADFAKRDPEGNIDRIFEKLIANAPVVVQAEARLEKARRNLEHAELDLRYCNITSEIEGVVTRKNVNPGNHVHAGEALMAVRSLTEIWIDANFKETQLAKLRIGQRVRCELDMYGRHKEFEGRITGFTMGTGQTLALLPPQNATGNFVKIVQRLPVRIELTDYDPDKEPLFVGLSVEPRVYYKEPPSGPNAGKFLQPLAQVPAGPTGAQP
jgi:membrane fusion protein (multidrug efflux system)